MEKINLCENCINLESWQSQVFESKNKVCSKIKILNPKIENCEFFIAIGLQNNNYLCRNCKHLDVWTSSDKKVISEVCPIRHLLLPIKYECDIFVEKDLNNAIN
jgi:hypothetical protein